ncbi:MAG: CIA30 family protein [Phototrophicaceae bacterium]
MSVLLAMSAILSGVLLMVFDFSNIEQVDAWSITDDGVMGGISQGHWYQEDYYVVFDGNVSLENNGGFSSARVGFLPADISAYDGVVLKVRGDGQQYAFGFRDMTSRYQHRLTFETTLNENNDWELIYIPFADLVANWFGRDVPTAAALNTTQVSGMNFIISDYQEGPFRLEIASIALYAADDTE